MSESYSGLKTETIVERLIKRIESLETRLESNEARLETRLESIEARIEPEKPNDPRAAEILSALTELRDKP